MNGPNIRRTNRRTQRKKARRRLLIFIFSTIVLALLIFAGVKTINLIKNIGVPQIAKDIIKKQQGRITILNLDRDTELPIKNNKYRITKLDSGEIVQIISTDKNGIATSMPLDYDSKYEVKWIESNPYYPIREEVFILEIDQENHEIIIESIMHDYIKQVHHTEEGELVVDEVFIEVPTIMQLPELPNGCEITSLTAVLNYKGYNAEKTEMADTYLPKEPFYRKDEKLFGANPYVAYAGDPREKHGFFSYAPPIVKAANHFLDKIKGEEKPIDISGSTREEIIKYLEQGIPVVIWVTLDLSKPIKTYSWHLSDTGEKVDMPINLHCVVLNGYAGDNVHVMNPLEGQVIYNADAFFQSYVELGSHAMTLDGLK